MKMVVLKLLQSQNRCLERLLECTESFLEHSFKLNSRDFSGLTSFQDQREVFLKAIHLYDRKISEVVSLLSESDKSDINIEKIRELIEVKEVLTKKLFDIDQKIITEIENEKCRLAQELSESDKNSQLVKKFKSKWVSESGETLDGTI